MFANYSNPVYNYFQLVLNIQFVMTYYVQLIIKTCKYIIIYLDTNECYRQFQKYLFIIF